MKRSESVEGHLNCIFCLCCHCSDHRTPGGDEEDEIGSRHVFSGAQEVAVSNVGTEISQAPS